MLQYYNNKRSLSPMKANPKIYNLNLMKPFEGRWYSTHLTFSSKRMTDKLFSLLVPQSKQIT